MEEQESLKVRNVSQLTTRAIRKERMGVVGLLGSTDNFVALRDEFHIDCETFVTVRCAE